MKYIKLGWLIIILLITSSSYAEDWYISQDGYDITQDQDSTITSKETSPAPTKKRFYFNQDVNKNSANNTSLFEAKEE